MDYTYFRRNGEIVHSDSAPVIVKIGTVELYEDEAAEFYHDNKYIVTYGGIWQIHHSVNAGYYGHKVITSKGLVKRGRWFALTAIECNDLLGKDCLITYSFESAI